MNDSLSRQTIQVIAQRVAACRKQQRLSLDQLAVRAGVSKGSLAGLEKGTGNPGIALLCQTASALGVSVSDLLEMSASRGAESFALNGGKVLWRGPMGGTARLIFGTPGPMMFELWEWEMFPGERYEAKPHSPGTKEILYPLRGRAGAALRGEEFEVGSGHGLFLETDAPHAYFCAGRQPARFRMIVIEAPETRT
ncbi:MAG: XRE family transcriptional regulator [Bryobacteraceae bacterium]|nr:XRE family transcriptional regulator [Bryobacteraceae bacterium]